MNINKFLKALGISLIALIISNVYLMFSRHNFVPLTFSVLTNNLYKPLPIYIFLVVLATIFYLYNLFFSEKEKKFTIKQNLGYCILIILSTTFVYCMSISICLFLLGFKRYNLNFNEILYTVFPLLSYKFLIILSISVFYLAALFIWDNIESMRKLLYIAILYLLYGTFEINNFISAIPAIKLNNYFFNHLCFILTSLFALLCIFSMALLLKSKNKLAVIFIIPILILSLCSFKTYNKNLSLAPTEVSVKNNNTTKSINEYTVTEYSMDVNLNENFSNKCTMKVTLNDPSTKTLKFDFYEKNNISSLTINNLNTNFEMKDSLLYVDIPDEIKDTTFTINLEYSSYIYTFVSYHNYKYEDNLSAETDFITDTCGFLSCQFPWYPMLDSEEKIFNIKINNCTTNLLSNLNVESNGDNAYTLNGSAKNIYLYKDNISKIQYKDYTIMASKDLLKYTDTIDRVLSRFKPDPFIDTKKSTIPDNIKTIIIVPPSCSINEITFNDTMLISLGDPVRKY